MSAPDFVPQVLLVHVLGVLGPSWIRSTVPLPDTVFSLIRFLLAPIPVLLSTLMPLRPLPETVFHLTKLSLAERGDEAPLWTRMPSRKLSETSFQMISLLLVWKAKIPCEPVSVISLYLTRWLLPATRMPSPPSSISFHLTTLSLPLMWMPLEEPEVPTITFLSAMLLLENRAMPSE